MVLALSGTAAGAATQVARVRISPRLAHVGGVALATLLSGLPLLQLKLMSGHDRFEYLPRDVEFFRALTNGQLIPRWAPEFGAGHGEPFFSFNPPLFYYLSAVFHALGSTFIAAEDLACLVLLLVAGLGMYVLASDFFGYLPKSLCLGRVRLADDNRHAAVAAFAHLNSQGNCAEERYLVHRRQFLPTAFTKRTGRRTATMSRFATRRSDTSPITPPPFFGQSYTKRYFAVDAARGLAFAIYPTPRPPQRSRASSTTSLPRAA